MKKRIKNIITHTSAVLAFVTLIVTLHYTIVIPSAYNLYASPTHVSILCVPFSLYASFTNSSTPGYQTPSIPPRGTVPGTCRIESPSGAYLLLATTGFFKQYHLYIVNLVLRN
jgi:hypothetical protein